MSGWRSGAGHRESLAEDVIFDPASVFDPTGRRRENVGAFAVVLLVAFGMVVGLIWYRSTFLPPHRHLPVPAVSAVTIVPVGRLPDGLLDGVIEDYRSEYGLSLTVAPPIELDPGLLGKDGRTVSAEAVARAAVLSQPAGTLAVAVTAGPIVTAGPDADDDVAERIVGAAVISTSPLVSMKTISRKTLFRRSLTRQLGILVWHLPLTDDPYDLLFRGVVTEVDLERVSDHL
jgi:hypothetical protein